jgi:hypothetical protein
MSVALPLFRPCQFNSDPFLFFFYLSYELVPRRGAGA